MKTTLRDRLEQAAREAPEQYSFKPLTDRDETGNWNTVSVGVCPVSNRRNPQGKPIFKAAVKRFTGKKDDWGKINAAAQCFCDKLNACPDIQSQWATLKNETKRETVK